MARKILVMNNLQNPEFESEARAKALDRLRDYAEVAFYFTSELAAEHAEGVVGVLADSVVFTPQFYAAARDLRIVARWGVGFEKNACIITWWMIRSIRPVRFTKTTPALSAPITTRGFPSNRPFALTSVARNKSSPHLKAAHRIMCSIPRCSLTRAFGAFSMRKALLTGD